MPKHNTIDLPVHVDDALLLIGVLAHAIAEGELNLEAQRIGRTTYNIGVNDTVSALVRLKSWRDALLAGNPSEYGVKAHAVYGRGLPKPLTQAELLAVQGFTDDTCSECGVQVPSADAATGVGRHHHDACRLYDASKP